MATVDTGVGLDELWLRRGEPSLQSLAAAEHATPNCHTLVEPRRQPAVPASDLIRRVQLLYASPLRLIANPERL